MRLSRIVDLAGEEAARSYREGYESGYNQGRKDEAMQRGTEKAIHKWAKETPTLPYPTATED